MLNDVLAPNLRIVFCGTAAGAVSAARGEYYAGRGNKFWPVLHETGLTPRRLLPSEFRSLLDFGLGLTDVVKGQAGADSSIDFKQASPLGVRARIEQYCPSVLAFNGKKAAQVFLGVPRVEFGLQRDSIGGTRLFVAPSTSGAANSTWDIGLWRELAGLVR